LALEHHRRPACRLADIRAVVCQHAELTVEALPEPVPAPGQARIEVLRAGICGSDLHARHGVDSWAEIADSVGYHRFARSGEPIVFGHEYIGTVAEYGPRTAGKLRSGTPVVAVPLIRNGEHVDSIGLSGHAPGAYAEQLLVQAALMLEVPNGLGADVAALTEPLAVAHHAVRRGKVSKRQTAIVIGCGPIGLAVVLMLKAAGVATVVASDFSAARRTLAVRCGADVVVDPALESPFSGPKIKLRGALRDAPAAFELAVGTLERLEKIPLVDWRHVWRLAETLGGGPAQPVIFECVGVPGMIDRILTDVPLFSRVVVAGVCVGPDTITPARAIQKEIDLRFVFGYTPLEFRDTLHLLADGKVDPQALITGTVGLDGVAGAFDALTNPELHAKILIDPQAGTSVPRV
jgi:threonine dehydrogenase-like Zn-dependent dehydrogenase